MDFLGTKRGIGVGLAALALGLIAWGGLIGFRSSDADVVTLMGNVDIRQVNLGFKVAEMKVDEGDRVTAGTVIASLDTSYFADEVRLARARVDAQTAVVARLENGTRPEEIAQARAIVAEREAAVALAEATLSRQQDLAGEPEARRTRAQTRRHRCGEVAARGRECVARTGRTPVGRCQSGSTRRGRGVDPCP